MRCYLLRNNKIEGVELLSPGSDEAAIKQAKTLFEARANQNYDSFEVWEERRLVYRSSDAAETPIERGSRDRSAAVGLQSG